MRKSSIENLPLPVTQNPGLLISPTTDNKSHFDLLKNSEVAVTVPVRSDSVQYGTVPPSSIPDTVHKDTVPEVTYPTLDRTDNVQYGTSLNQDLVPVTVPIRSNTVQHHVPPSESPSTVYSDNVPDTNLTNPHRTNTEDYSTLSNLDYVPVMVPPSFVQGLNMPKRTDSCLRNKYKQKRKLSRTPIVVPRIIECAKDANPHLDQDNILTVITMDLEVAPLAVLEPAPGAPEITRTGVCSNSSLIPNSITPVVGGKNRTYFPTGCISNVRTC